MKEYGLNSADFIKCLFIDSLLSKNEELIIGNEFMYGVKRKVVDLVILQKNKIIAVEIKSDNDNLNRLEEQILEYKKIFDYVVVVTTEKHKEKISEFAPSDIGIYVFNEEYCIKKIREPHIQKKKDKVEILYSINTKYLRKLGKHISNKYNADEIRGIYVKRRISYIQEILLAYLIEKYKTKFVFFMNERGTLTHIEDLSILSSSFQIE